MDTFRTKFSDKINRNPVKVSIRMDAEASGYGLYFDVDLPSFAKREEYLLESFERTFKDRVEDIVDSCPRCYKKIGAVYNYIAHNMEDFPIEGGSDYVETIDIPCDDMFKEMIEDLHEEGRSFLSKVKKEIESRISGSCESCSEGIELVKDMVTFLGDAYGSVDLGDIDGRYGITDAEAEISIAFNSAKAAQEFFEDITGEERGRNVDVDLDAFLDVEYPKATLSGKTVVINCGLPASTDFNPPKIEDTIEGLNDFLSELGLSHHNLSFKDFD